MKKESLIPIVTIVVALFFVVHNAQADQITDPNGSLNVMGGEYRVYNNVWGASTPQTLEVDPNSTYFKVVSTGHNQSGGAPASYPFILKGSHFGGTPTSPNNPLPIPVPNVTSAPTSWTISGTGAAGIWDAAYDNWFVQGSTNKLEMMIWINYKGGCQPAGSQVAMVSLAGYTWQVWKSGSGEGGVLSYRITTLINSISYDLRVFMDDAISRGYLNTSWSLGAFEAGFEIWTNGSGLTSESFTAIAYTGGGNTPPTVSITSPTNGATFTSGSNVTINANASDADGSVTKVDFYQGSTLLGTDTSSPYSYTWTSPANGSYSLTAKATDNAGATTTSSAVNITVGNPPINVEAESMALTNYASNTNTSASGGSLIKLSASGVTGTATANFTGSTGSYDIKVYYYDENDGACTFNVYVAGTKVGTWVANQNLGSADPVAATRTSQTITSISIANGAQIKLEAVQNSQEWGRYDNVEFTLVGVANNPPTVSITSPANGATFTAPATVTINADASDSDGSVTLVEFFQGSTKLGEDSSSPYSYTWNNVAAGSYSLTAKATDNGGATTTSSAVNITVNEAPPSGSSMEAESMSLTNYVVNTNSSASGGNLIKLSASGVTGNATYNFSGSTGTYDVTAYYYDENDGTCTFRIYVGGTMVDEWVANQNLGSADPVSQTRTSRTKSDVSIANGAQIKLEAIQNSQEWGRFDNVEITSSNQPPTVSITSPANGATFTAPANITINADASDSDGSVTLVEFFQGGTKLGEDTSSPYSYTWNSVAAGSYSLTAKATDNGGAATTSSAVNITVSSGGGGGGSYEAESGTLAGGATVTSSSAASGGAYVGNLHIVNSSVTVSGVDGGSGGSFPLTIRYATNDANPSLDLFVNSTLVNTITFASTGGWETFTTTSTNVTLNAGTGNTIKFQHNSGNSGGTNIDVLTVGSAPSTISKEAESMTLTNYTVNSNSSASGGNLIKLSASGVTGNATFNFTGTTGTYNIKAYYYDENDGACTFRIYVGGTMVDEWVANQNLGSADPVAATRTSRTKTGVSITNGAQIKLEAVQNSQEWGRYDLVEITTSLGKPMVQEEGENCQPTGFSLDQNYPNPFNPETFICYQLPEASKVQLEIYDITGSKVRVLVNSEQSAGSHTVCWNGQNESGQKVTNGMYIYRFKATGANRVFTQNRKMLLLK